MRGVFQQHHNVSYIFIGSQESMIRDIFQEKKNPFYKFGRQITLQPISETHMVAFVKERFTSVGINAQPHISDILKITGYHPYYTQQLCYELYVILQAKKHHQIAKDDIVQAQQTIITQHNVDYRAWWNALNTTDRKIIIGIANGMTEPSSQAFIQKYGIRSTSTAITATNKLIKKGYLIRNSKTGVLAVEDPFWQQWILASRS